MEWNQLHYFQTVAQLQHFTQAAEAMSISQPALSRSMARLEDELGVPLFERQGRRVALSSYGQIFLKRVNRALQEISLGQQELQNLLDPFKGSVALGFIHSQGSNLVPDLLGLFRQKFPHVRFQLYQNTAHRLLESLEAADIDFCFCSQPSAHEHIRWARLFTEEIVLIVPAGHPLAGRAFVTLAELAGEPFILFKKDVSLGEIIYGLCREAGFTPKATFEGEEVGTVSGLVAAKLGIALVPRNRAAENTGIVQVPISRPKCQRVIGIAWIEERHLTPAAQHFREFVLGHFGASLPS
ncbi:Transcription regulator HTH, LysR [Acididesulfobacillus acetoxydans]|uniref:HTH-type transcriptional regulator GltC n=1 Tax=Acididesulfobacillus acetoxydans TaxID=1561005 RepID=A0A8S0WKW1_9FIRM|nr:LysR substrate-binding domain-containing protein [Acididesulfobacillus acetoxydans]CAA7599654.1 Transcription regulator HTH, LysR [Acididesulfobacillus acetoxydans]CEJ06206.1 HTH-type transcriptional regulator GltC [Acididesulfobacillus acetoxydans]